MEKGSIKPCLRASADKPGLTAPAVITIKGRKNSIFKKTAAFFSRLCKSCDLESYLYYFQSLNFKPPL